MSEAPSDEQEIDALAKVILGELEKSRRPILFHLSALAVVIATVTVSTGQWKEAHRYIMDLSKQLILKRRKETVQ